MKSLHLPWETIADNGQWILIHQFPIPPGYNQTKATIGVMIPPGYPVAQLDMAYIYPHLTRVDNFPIRALAPHSLDGKIFQRWSRHRTGENPWRPGVDDLSTHLAAITIWFEKELKR
ncbi:hypothetical protein KK083_09700 [Fulvivirgaceae bacterium PWU4]|uniref:Uncharacterized protein n=2 Tax=Chryseosolibacter histidini TaxID=2782349 RepID=A0AAP2GMM5_9BACT|nr:hypothetical protein [Chryseosolibacter histidini]